MVKAIDRLILALTAADKDKARMWIAAWRSVGDIQKRHASTRGIERYWVV
jgi:hypothetical protein